MTLKNNQKVLCVLLLCAMLIALAGCSQSPDVKPQVSSAKGIRISSEVLNKVGLDEKWAIDSVNSGGAKIKHILKKGNNLLIYNSDSILYCLNMDTGRTKWEKRFPKKFGNIALLSYYQNRVLLAISNNIFEIDIDSGVQSNNWEVPFKPTSTVARDENYLFVGGSDNMFYCLELPNLVGSWKSLHSNPPKGDIWIDTRIVEGETVGSIYFACNNGKMYATSYEKPSLLWTLETTGDIPGCVFNKDACFLPSTDTSLYCVNSQSGRIFWKFLAGGKLYDLPSITSNYVYQAVRNKSLVCLERYPDGNSPASGLERVSPEVVWELDKGTKFICEVGSRVYAATELGQLVVMNNNTGEKEGSIDIPGVDMIYSNPDDDYLVLANEAGAVTVLRPVK